MKTTEAESEHKDLENKSIKELLNGIHTEDKKILPAVEKALPQIEKLVEQIVPRMKKGGRLFYIGAGTSGRLGILDASEIPPTYGMEPERVIGLIAGGDTAIRNAVENAEDNKQAAWKEIRQYSPTINDCVIGIAASGSTPYVIEGVKSAQENGLVTGCITNNKESILADSVAYPIEVIVGPEFVTGSTRMKAGTSQKLVLNMITTSVMIKLGRVKGNKMVNMQLSNDKLVLRAKQMIIDELNVSEIEASELLQKYESVQKILSSYTSNK